MGKNNGYLFGKFRDNPSIPCPGDEYLDWWAVLTNQGGRYELDTMDGDNHHSSWDGCVVESVGPTGIPGTAGV